MTESHPLYREFDSITQLSRNCGEGWLLQESAMPLGFGRIIRLTLRDYLAKIALNCIDFVIWG